MNNWFKQIGLTLVLIFSTIGLAQAGTSPTAATDGQIWSQLKAGATGVTTSDGEFHNQPINTYDLRVFELRSDILAPALMAALFGMIIIFIVFIKVNGISKLHGGYSGKLVYRWSKFDVSIHWLGAIPCLLLILTG